MNVVEHLMEGGDKLLDKTFLLNASKIGYLLRKPTWAPSETWVSMQDKVCVVTGGNSGLGRVVSTRLAGLGPALTYCAAMSNVGNGRSSRS